jgi:hypothetical protein
LPCGLATFPNGPYYQRLVAPRIASDEHVWYADRVGGAGRKAMLLANAFSFIPGDTP